MNTARMIDSSIRKAMFGFSCKIEHKRRGNGFSVIAGYKYSSDAASDVDGGPHKFGALRVADRSRLTQWD